MSLLFVYMEVIVVVVLAEKFDPNSDLKKKVASEVVVLRKQFSRCDRHFVYMRALVVLGKYSSKRIILASNLFLCI